MAQRILWSFLLIPAIAAGGLWLAVNHPEVAGTLLVYGFIAAITWTAFGEDLA